MYKYTVEEQENAKKGNDLFLMKYIFHGRPQLIKTLLTHVNVNEYEDRTYAYLQVVLRKLCVADRTLNPITNYLPTLSHKPEN